MDAFPIPGHENVSIVIGDDVQVNDYVHISACESVTIGNHVLVASKVYISDHDHGRYGGDQAHDSPDTPPNSSRRAGISGGTTQPPPSIRKLISYEPG